MNAKAKRTRLRKYTFYYSTWTRYARTLYNCLRLAEMTDYALEIKKFADIVNTKSITISINGQINTK